MLSRIQPRSGLYDDVIINQQLGLLSARHPYHVKVLRVHTPLPVVWRVRNHRTLTLWGWAPGCGESLTPGIKANQENTPHPPIKISLASEEANLIFNDCFNGLSRPDFHAQFPLSCYKVRKHFKYASERKVWSSGTRHCLCLFGGGCRVLECVYLLTKQQAKPCGSSTCSLWNLHVLISTSNNCHL